MDPLNTNKKFFWLLRRGWEKMFPNLKNDWTHYLIIGDNKELDIIDGLSLIKALDVVENNFGQYKLIMVHRAQRNAKGVFIFEKDNFYISTYSSDKNKLTRLINDYEGNTLK